jgi:nicotinamide riboside kinase
MPPQPNPRPSPRRIALLGAESTGKTELALAIGEALRQQGHTVAVVSEVLREWCDREGRTPGADDQAAIAQEQARRVLAQDAVDFVIADTTPLMTAIYSHLLFRDESLYAFALAHQQIYDATLVTGLDLSWQADGLQRDGPHVREPVDAMLRAALFRSGMTWQVVYGAGVTRRVKAMNAIFSIANHDQNTLGKDPETLKTGVWAWSCEKCSDPACEHRLFTGLLGP